MGSVNVKRLPLFAPWLSARTTYYLLTAVVCIAGIAILWRTLYSPFGYALRAIRRSPGFASVVVLLIAIGVGAMPQSESDFAAWLLFRDAQGQERRPVARPTSVDSISVDESATIRKAFVRAFGKAPAVSAKVSAARAKRFSAAVAAGEKAVAEPANLERRSAFVRSALASLENAFVPITTSLDPGFGEDWLYTGRAFAIHPQEFSSAGLSESGGVNQRAGGCRELGRTGRAVHHHAFQNDV